MPKTKKPAFFYRNSLSIVMLSFMLLFWFGQAYTGWKEHNKELTENGARKLNFNIYLQSGHFIQATFENWESEFLQMALYVLLTVSLRQVGSSESKSIEGKEEVDREPKPHKTAPWPVKKGGFILKIYKNSLSMAFILLFIISFGLHAYGSWQNNKVEQQLKHLPVDSFSAYLQDTRF